MRAKRRNRSASAPAATALWRGRVDPALLSRAAVLASVIALEEGASDEERSQLTLTADASALTLSIALASRRPDEGGVHVQIAIAAAGDGLRSDGLREAAPAPPAIALRLAHAVLVTALRKTEGDAPHRVLGARGETVRVTVRAEPGSSRPTGLSIELPARRITRTLPVIGPGETSSSERPPDDTPRPGQPVTATLSARDLFEAGAIAGERGGVMLVPDADGVMRGVGVIGVGGAAAALPEPRERSNASLQEWLPIGDTPSRDPAPLSPRAARALGLALHGTTSHRRGRASSVALARTDTDSLVARLSDDGIHVTVRDMPSLAYRRAERLDPASVAAITAPTSAPAVRVRVAYTEFTEALHHAQRMGDREVVRRTLLPEAVAPTELVLRWEPPGDAPRTGSASHRPSGDARLSGSTRPKRRRREPWQPDAGVSRESDATGDGLTASRGRTGSVSVLSASPSDTMRTAVLPARGLGGVEEGHASAVALSVSALAALTAYVGGDELDLDIWADVVRISDAVHSRSAVIPVASPAQLPPLLRTALAAGRSPAIRAPTLLLRAARSDLVAQPRVKPPVAADPQRPRRARRRKP